MPFLSLRLLVSTALKLSWLTIIAIPAVLSYITVYPLRNVRVPFPVHQLSLIPKMSVLFSCISLGSCAAFDVSVIVLTFQYTVFVFRLGSLCW